jgi:predicted ester cyclase
MEDQKAIVLAFYTDCLTVNPHTDLAQRMDQLLADDFQSINAAETKNKATLMAQVPYFWRLMPDLKWMPQEILQDGNRLIVRSTFTATPKGDFMGMILDGTRSFSTMSIDIHTVVNGKITTIYHLEEWSTAIAQLKG